MTALTTQRREQPARVPEELLRSVMACFDPVRVILFGSHARRAGRIRVYARR